MGPYRRTSPLTLKFTADFPAASTTQAAENDASLIKINLVSASTIFLFVNDFQQRRTACCI